jgi:hypothetical protein
MAQGVLPLISRLKARLNHMMDPVARDADLGTRLGEYEFYGTLAYSYASGHADKTYASADLPITPVVFITLTLADAGAILYLPTDKKIYVVYNNSGQTVTVKVTGQTGVALTTGTRALLICNGTDIVNVSSIAVLLDATQTLTAKTLTTPTINGGTISTAAITGGTINSAALTGGTHASGTFTAPLINGGSINSAAITGGTISTAAISGGTIDSAALTGGSLTNAIVTTPDLRIGISTKSFTAGITDWALSATEKYSISLAVTGSITATATITVPDSVDRIYFIKNGGSSATITIKTSGGTGIAVATGKYAIVAHSGSDFISLMPDQ